MSIFIFFSEASEAPDLEPHVNIPNVEREATDFDIINEAEEPIDIAGFNMVPVIRFAKATQPSTEETLPPANPSDEPDIGNVVGFNIKSGISQQPLIGSYSNFKLKLI